MACWAFLANGAAVASRVPAIGARNRDDGTDLLGDRLHGEHRVDGSVERAVVARRACTADGLGAVGAAGAIGAFGVGAATRTVVASITERCHVAHAVGVAVVAGRAHQALRAVGGSEIGLVGARRARVLERAGGAFGAVVTWRTLATFAAKWASVATAVNGAGNAVVAGEAQSGIRTVALARAVATRFAEGAIGEILAVLLIIE